MPRKILKRFSVLPLLLAENSFDIFSTCVDPTTLDNNRAKWEIPPTSSSYIQTAIRTSASSRNQVHFVPKPNGDWRFILDFVRPNSATSGLEGWPIPNIQHNLSRVGTLRPKVFSTSPRAIITLPSIPRREHSLHSQHPVVYSNGLG